MRVCSAKCPERLKLLWTEFARERTKFEVVRECLAMWLQRREGARH
jgi:hypothetical protein